MLVATTNQDVWFVSLGGSKSSRTSLPHQGRLIVQGWKDRIIVAQQGHALWEVKDGRLEPFENPLPDKSDTYWHGSDESFVLTSRALYRHEKDGWRPLSSTKSFAGQAVITSVTRWGDLVAAATFTHGLALFDLRTGQLQLTTRAVGLDTPTLLCTYAD
jgi:hypothetical protein